MTRNITDFKPYVPARDFELSKRFYMALGFTLTPGYGQTVDCDFDGHRFRLQDYYQRKWADNFMFVIDVDDVAAWRVHVQQMLDSGEFGTFGLKAPEEVDGALVLNVWDPSGVLLIFVQALDRSQ